MSNNDVKPTITTLDSEDELSLAQKLIRKMDEQSRNKLDSISVAEKQEGAA